MSVEHCLCELCKRFSLLKVECASNARYGGDCSDVRHQLVRVRQIQSTGGGGFCVGSECLP